MTYPYDEYDDAMKDEPRKFFGLCTTSARKVVLVKGQGKVEYDPAIHNGQRTSLAVNVTVTPCDPTAKLIMRDVLNWTPEFTQAIRPSLEKLADKIKAVKGLTVKEINPLREINGLWVAGEFVPRPGNKAGETWTTLKMTDVFKCEADCMAAYEVYAKSNGGSDTASTPQDATEQPAAPKVDPNKDALVAAFPVLWTAAGGDANKFTTSIAGLFAPDAPEVVKFLADQVF
jgi:hypothetical protein